VTFTGCEETGADGMITFLENAGEQLGEALFINFELVGIGERLVYLRSEGVVRKRRISSAVESLILAVNPEHALEAINGAGLGVFTETGVVWEYGYQGVCLVTLKKGSPLLPEWHRLTDTTDRLQADALHRVHEFAWALLQKIDLGSHR
jgi:hypothetical protein